MANPRKRVPENAPGDFFVDSTCIDCDTCRQIAPRVFGEGPGGRARQPDVARKPPFLPGNLPGRLAGLHQLVSVR